LPPSLELAPVLLHPCRDVRLGEKIL
jgi:hypothetical protein